jgi:hypothetical protein
MAGSICGGVIGQRTSPEIGRVSGFRRLTVRPAVPDGIIDLPAPLSRRGDACSGAGVYCQPRQRHGHDALPQSWQEKRNAHKNPGGQILPSGKPMAQSLGRKQMLLHS